MRNALDSEPSSWVGQKVQFHIDLMSASFFSGTAHFDLPDIPGAIVMKVKGSPTVGSESVDGETWSTQRHRFMVYSQRAGKIEIPAFPVRFSVSEGFGKPKKEQRLKTTPMDFESKMPPGAEGYSLLVSTTELNAKETWSVSAGEKETVQLFVGDAITRKISTDAADIPAMALPSIPFPEVEGLTRYSNPPEINDKEYRGSLTGQRTESVTYVCEGSGEFVMPGMVITWWNTSTKKLEKESFPALNISVVIDPSKPVESSENVEAGETEASNGRQNMGFWIGILVSATVVYLGWRFIENRVLHILRDKRRQQTEPKLFKNVEQACHRNEPIETHNALMKWIEATVTTSNAATLEDYLAACNGEPELSRQLDLLQQVVIGKVKSWDGEKLISILQQHRNRDQSRKAKKKSQPLPTLNPVSNR